MNCKDCSRCDQGRYCPLREEREWKSIGYKLECAKWALVSVAGCFAVSAIVLLFV